MSHSSRSDGSGGYRETGKEQRDASCGLCRPHHEQRTHIPFGHIPRPVTRAIEVTLPNPLFCFLVHNHFFIHSHACIHTFIPYIQALHMQLLHHNASCCVTKR